MPRLVRATHRVYGDDPLEDETKEDGKKNRTWLTVIVGLGMLALVARYHFPGVDLGHLGGVVTILVAVFWAREGRPLGPAARWITVAVVGVALLGGIAVHSALAGPRVVRRSCEGLHLGLVSRPQHGDFRRAAAGTQVPHRAASGVPRPAGGGGSGPVRGDRDALRGDAAARRGGTGARPPLARGTFLPRDRRGARADRLERQRAPGSRGCSRGRAGGSGPGTPRETCWRPRRDSS